MRTRFRLAASLLVVLIIACGLVPALAQAAPSLQGGDREAQADALYAEAIRLHRANAYQAALAKYQSALEIYRETGNLTKEGRCLGNIGAAHSDLGQYQKALEYFEESRTISREVGDRAGEGNTLNNTGNVYIRLGQYQKALAYYEEALVIKRELGNRAGEGQTLSNIGVVYDILGQYQEALKYYYEALTISREIGDRPGEGSALNNVGIAHYNLGQCPEALQYFEESLIVDRELGNRAGEAISLSNIGNAYLSLGQYQEALEYHEEALAIDRELGNRFGEASKLTNIGLVYWYLAQHQEALKFHEESLTIRREIGDRRGEGTSLYSIGNVYRILGEYNQALGYFEESLAISREIGDRPGEGLSLNAIADVYQNLEQYQEALKYLEEALAINREVGSRLGEGDSLSIMGTVYRLSGQYPEALRSYEGALAISHEIGNRREEAEILDSMGRVYYVMGENEKALDSYLQSLAVYEEIRGAITVEELKTTYVETYQNVYALLVSLLMELGQPEEAFHYAERARARTLLDRLGNIRIDPRQSDDPVLVEQEETLRLKIGVLEKALQEEWAKSRAQRNDEQIKSLTAQLEDKRAEYARLLETLKLKNPEYASLVAVNPLTLKEIQELLPGTTLIEYFVTERKTFAFVVSQDAFQAETIKVERKDLQRMLSSFRDFASLEGTPGEMTALYDALFAPVRSHVKTASLIIAPHRLLHYLPFQALHDGEGYLVQDYTISYIPSASVLPFALEKRKEGLSSALVLGNPAVPGVPAVVYASEEANEVAALYGARAYNQETASEALFRAEAGQAGLIHLACHGQYNPQAPLFSRLLLAPGGEHDGYLNVHELYNIELPQADLVTLSACQTQLGQVSEGDEVIGLSRALIYAGAPTIVASLWTVDDLATSELMLSFYKHLKEGLSKAEALRAAQIEVQAEYPHPYYWAAFVLTGDPGQAGGGVAAGVGAATESAASESTPDEAGRRLCVSAALPLMVMVLAGIRRGHTLWKAGGHETR